MIKAITTATLTLALLAGTALAEEKTTAETKEKAPVSAPAPVAPADTPAVKAANVPAKVETHTVTFKKDGKEVKTLVTVVNDKQVQEIVKNGAVLIDARSADDFKAGHIKGAHNLTAKTITEESLSKITSGKDQTLVFYCGSPSCPASMYAAEAAAKLGYTSLFKYKGGIEDWTAKKHPVVKG